MIERIRDVAIFIWLLAFKGHFLGWGWLEAPERFIRHEPDFTPPRDPKGGLPVLAPKGASISVIIPGLFRFPKVQCRNLC